ncbi:MAG: PAS domain-containing sensor histidine kinase [Gemmatimonadota bacterium]|nr:PAS domain-containing sensor histidine kinase [Gemmatimonadota bacterium]
MTFGAAPHPVVYLAVLAATFSWLGWRYRTVPFLLWGAGWALLLARQLAPLGTLPRGAAGWIDAGLVVAAAATILLAGMGYAGRERLGPGGGLLYGAFVGALAAGVLVVFAATRPEAILPSTVTEGLLVASAIGTGGLIARFGRSRAPVGASVAGWGLVAWAAAQPAVWIAAGPSAATGWPALADAVLGAALAAGAALLGFEEIRSRSAAGRTGARQILNEDPNMIAVMQDGQYVFANRALFERTGLREEELLEIGLFERIAPEDRGEASRMLEQRRRDEPVADYELEIVTADGSRLPVLVHGDRIEWEGRPAFKYELTDLTVRRRAEDEVRAINEELQRINRELERSNQLKSEFLSNTSHELKTPLTSIIANTEILEYEMCGPVNDEQRRVLSSISRNSQHLLDMISRLLDFARHQETSPGVHYGRVALRTLLDSVRQTVLPLVENEPHEIEIVVDEEAEPCWMDGEKIYRVYLNLVENAIKFAEGGRVEVGARTVDGEVEGWVSDEGIGIPAEKITEIFEAFHQVDSSATRSYPGVGLGLAICKQLVELHGGRIWAESEPGEGSTFRFRLPIRDRPPDGAEEAGATAADEGT